MQIHQISKGKNKDRKRIGRGGKRGTFSGRGCKGQKARSGAKVDPLFEGGRSSLVERLKKLRGFKSPHAKKNTINLSDLDKCYNNSETVDTESLLKFGLVSRKNVKNGIKIIGNKKFTKVVMVDEKIFLSKSARELIEKAGGKIVKK